MLIPQRHPTMKRAVSSEHGLMGTYTAAVVAVMGTFVAAGVYLSAPQEVGEGESVLIAAEIGPVWVDAAPQSATQAPPVTAKKRSSPSGLSIRGADLDDDQPVYDESAGVMIRRKE